ncbi:MAG: hypothetical protein KAS23_15145 [Anaerohalosphaera sp.]|nr:hypothetical protein [Anaerohalosphaera sp.]
MDYQNKYFGSCYCGNIKLHLHSNKNESQLVPRICSCPFCTRHGASYISDTQGELQVNYDDPENVSRFRFGHKTADFIVCAKCGVLVTVLSEIQGQLRAVININSMPDHQFKESPIVTNFEGEKVEDRLARRAKNWIGNVVVDPAE